MVTDVDEKTYVDGLLDHLIPLQDDLLDQEATRRDICPSVGRDIGRLLYLLIRLMKPDQVLEIGTGIGYAAVWMGLALRETGGRLVTVEAHERLVIESQNNIENAGLAGVIEVIHGRAEDVLPELDGPFGMILQDGGTRSYPDILTLLTEKLSPGGLLVADDVLFALRSGRPGPRQYMADHNRKLFDAPELFSTLLAVGDGLTLSIRKEEEAQ